ncbi:PEP-CTERM sorting domain-containing protein [Planctomycetes bacterium K23_9]|uniref:Ice-binding protein C-terminal domain-containing protein n=1 Tax=Stieleria marina TaxID=1930275 RepID=A0A517NZQ8_9BACT|nr:hypothetical protein K239x_46190 [Planctomycetes bacterium K23_9]
MSRPTPKPSDFAIRFLIVGLISCTASTNALAAVFANYTPSRHDRFLSDGSVNNDFIMAGFDLSGISLGTPGDGTTGGVDPIGGTSRAILITPQHYISANHASTTTPRFRGSDGVIRSYTSSSSTQLTTTRADGTSDPSDIRLFTLSAPIPESDLVNPFAIYSGSTNLLVGEEFFLISNPSVNADESLTHRAGMNVIRDVEEVGFGAAGTSPTTNIYYTFDTAANGGSNGTGGDTLGIDEAGLIGGDSGNPALIAIDGQLAVLGTHFGISVPSGKSASAGDFYHNYSTLLTPYLSEIEMLTAADGQSIYRLSISVTAVPEPSSALLLFFVAAGGMHRRSRRPSNRK